ANKTRALRCRPNIRIQHITRQRRWRSYCRPPCHKRVVIARLGEGQRRDPTSGGAGSAARWRAPLEETLPVPRGAHSIQRPDSRTTATDEEENEAKQHGWFALIERGQGHPTELQFPVKLEVGNGHGAAAEQRRPTGLESKHDQ